MLELLGKDSSIRDLLVDLSNPGSQIELFRSGWEGLGPLLAFLQSKLAKTILYIGVSEERVRSLFSDCSLFSDKARFFPPRQPVALEDPVAEGERTALLEELLARTNRFLFCTLNSLLSPVRSPVDLKKTTLCLREGKGFPFHPFLGILESWKYFRTSAVIAPNEFAVRGGIVDLYPLSAGQPYRIEWSGDKIDTLRIFDPASQRSTRKIPKLELFPPENKSKSNALILDYLPPNPVVIGDSPIDWKKAISAVAAESPDFFREPLVNRFLDWLKSQTFLKLILATSEKSRPWAFHAPENFTRRFRSFLDKAHKELNRGESLFIYSRQASRLREVLTENGLSSIVVEPLPLSHGFCLPSQKLQVYTDRELFGRVLSLPPHRKSAPSAPVALEELKEGELVVHSRHGIASFDGIVPISVAGKVEDYLCLSFAGKDKLYVPLDEMIEVQRYVGPPERTPPLCKIGTAEWRNAKKHAREAARGIAQDLVRLYASRSRISGHACSPDTPWQAELEEAFPFLETPDQKTAILEMKNDMESRKPMDRLVLGDVGYGKTEVALRAAFKAVMDGNQVVVLVPTTILAQQHYETFSERLATFPVRIETLSRFKKKKEQERILTSLAEGEVDIIIGTHRLLQKDVVMKNLGLLIIDEEQRFGVAHKESLKKLRQNIDVLTLSATPIPRTLYFSLTGIRDMTVIETPPLDRLPVKTFVVPKDDNLIRQAIRQELKREGQVYYLYNRVADIEPKAGDLQRLVPEARIAVAHGQMKPAHLEEIMWEFLKGFHDVLLCTTIIENGLDIPRVNTLLVEDAEQYGLADLYQLRGRVGRSDRQAYAYFFTFPRNEVTGPAQRRLQTLEEFTHLGSGYQIAFRDLELRGAGNLLGHSQHGHLAKIGFHLYCQLLADEVKKLKGEKLPKPTPKVWLEIPIPAYLPDTYIEPRSHKLDLYRRLASAKTLERVEEIRMELADRFGPVPDEALNLIEMVKIKLTCLEKHIREIKLENSRAVLSFWDRSDALSFPMDEGLPVKVRLELLKSELSVVEKRFR